MPNKDFYQEEDQNCIITTYFLYRTSAVSAISYSPTGIYPGSPDFVIHSKEFRSSSGLNTAYLLTTPPTPMRQLNYLFKRDNFNLRSEIVPNVSGTDKTSGRKTQDHSRDFRRRWRMNRKPGGSQPSVPGYSYKEVRVADKVEYEVIRRADKEFYRAVYQPKIILRLTKDSVRSRHNPKMARSLFDNSLEYDKITFSPGPYFPDMDLFRYDVHRSKSFQGQPLAIPWLTFGLSRNPIADPRDYLLGSGPLANRADYPLSLSEHIKPLDRIAISRLYATVKNQKVDLATELSQIAQTLGLITDAAKRIAKGIIALKKLNLTGAIKAVIPSNLKGVANDRLAYVYGVKPLLSDVVGAAEHLSEFLRKVYALKRNGHAKKTIRLETSYDSYNEFGLFSVTKVTRDITIRVKYSVTYRISDKLDLELSRLGFTNPANVIWELIPFSFVVDWFIKIGDFLNTMNAFRGLKFVSAYRTLFIKESCTMVTSIKSQAASAGDLVHDWSFSFPNDNSEWHRSSFTRVFNTREILLDFPEIELPSFKSPVSLDHGLNSAALAIQKLR